MDFKRAFDSADHDVLSAKLSISDFEIIDAMRSCYKAFPTC